jgi:hypothetical protein
MRGGVASFAGAELHRDAHSAVLVRACPRQNCIGSSPSAIRLMQGLLARSGLPWRDTALPFLTLLGSCAES